MEQGGEEDAPLPPPIPFRVVLGACDMGTKNWAGCIIDYTAPARRRKPRKRAATDTAPSGRGAKRRVRAVYEGKKVILLGADGQVVDPEAYDDDSDDPDAVGEGRESVVTWEPTPPPPLEERVRHEDYDHEVVPGEQIRVLSFRYLDLERHMVLGQYDTVGGVGPFSAVENLPHVHVAMGHEPTPPEDKDVLNTEIYRILPELLQHWPALFQDYIPEEGRHIFFYPPPRPNVTDFPRDTRVLAYHARRQAKG